jgi:hypothetical protein
MQQDLPLANKKASLLKTRLSHDLATHPKKAARCLSRLYSLVFV